MAREAIKQFKLEDVEPSSIEASLEKGSRIVDPVCGIVRSIMPNWLEHGDAQVFAYGAVACQASPLSIGPQIIRSGGASLDRDQAIAATIGEAVERYCAAYSDPEELFFGAYKDLKDDAVHPDEFCLYSKSQHAMDGFPFAPFTAESPVTWTWGFSLQQQKPVLVPASLAHLPLYLEDLDRETKIASTTSTGLACGNTIEEAILSAIGEAVERDSITCFWMNRMPARRVVIDDASAIFDVYKERFALPGLEYYTCEVTTDLGIPTLFTLLIGNSTDGIMVNVGSQANLSPSRSALKSLVEAAHGRPYVRFILQGNPGWKYEPDFSNVNSFQDHAAFYTRAPQHHDVLDFIKEPVSTRKLSEIPDLSTGTIKGDIKTYVSILARHNLDVIAADLTTPDIDEVGFKVVRVMIPGLQLLHGDHRYPFLGCERLFRMPQSLGFRETVSTAKELNPFPHPLP
jgi:ribosomal protein S12 methylthiotransferase accessory factor